MPSETTAPIANRQQAQLWNEASGPVWVELQRVLDAMLAPFEAHLTANAFPGEGRAVLDIGCGAGATTLAMARRLGANGLCLGADISAPLVAAAKARATKAGLAQAAFLCADAQTHAFEPGAFDVVISRFGVMFFDDPVAAFANLRAATASSGHLAFVAWRSPAENPFFTAAAHAIAPFLPEPPAPPAPDAPGQFAFADPDRVRRILADAGWNGVALEPLDEACRVPAADLMAYATKLGPAGAALRAMAPATRDDAIAALEAAMAPYIEGGEACHTAACWWVTARR